MQETGGLSNLPIDWSAVWRSVTTHLIEDKLPPKFLTEDRIRTATLRALDTQIDLTPNADIEYPAVNLGGIKGDRLDLVVREPAGTIVVEFKYPREPRQTQPPWPDHLGSFLADTYRLGVLARGGQVQRAIQLLVSGAAFLGFVQRTTTRFGLADYQPGERTAQALTLTPSSAAKLAKTTRDKIQRYEAQWEIAAARTAAYEITGKGLWLAAYDIQGTRAMNT